MRAIVEAPFVKSLTILSLYSGVVRRRLCADNPSIAVDAETFVSILTKAIEEHRFESIKMMYMGRARLRVG